MKTVFICVLVLIATIGLGQTNAYTKVFKGPTAATVFGASTPDEKKFISVSFTEIRVWDFTTGKCTKTISDELGDYKFTKASLSPDGQQLITGTSRNEIALWSIITGKLLKTFKGHISSDVNDFNEVNAVAFSPNGLQFVSGSTDKTIKLWDIQTGKCLETFTGHTDPVYSVAFSPNGKQIASATNGGDINIWDIQTGAIIKAFKGSTAFISSLSYSPDGLQLLFSTYDNALCLWDVTTGKKVRDFIGHKSQTECSSFNSTGSLIASCDGESIKLWDTNTGKCLKTFAVAAQTFVSFSGSDKYLISSQGTLGEETMDTYTTTDCPHIYLFNVSTYSVKSLITDIDKLIPQTAVVNNDVFVVIIANENYVKEAKVSYALNDGKIFKQYCEKTLGIPSDNIHLAENASLGDIIAERDWLSNNLKAYKGDAKAIFYYAGHGIPGGQNQPAYLLPVDGSSENLLSALMLDDLYSSLTKNPSKGVTVFLDACFSGSSRDAGMLASARGTKLKPRESTLPGNMVVFSAASGDETAWPYKDMQHGMFTYYLLKKLQETKGDVNYKALADYINDNVYKTAIKLNNKPQTPTTKAGTEAIGWENWKLK